MLLDSHSSSTREREAIGYAVRDALFLARSRGAAVKLSSRCPACGHWGSLSRPASSLIAPGYEPRREPSKALLSLVHRLRCQGCGIRPFAGVETITVLKSNKGKEKRGGNRLQGRRRL